MLVADWSEALMWALVCGLVVGLFVSFVGTWRG